MTLDTNCIIDSFKPCSCAFEDMQKIIEAYYKKQIIITVSRHTLSEIREPLEALKFAQSLQILPHYPIGTFGDQVATWEQLEGTFDDAKRNDDLQEELEQLAKSGNDIRDRGAYIDALNANVDAFVTSDGQFAKSGPAKRIEDRFGLRVVTPKQFVEELGI